MTGQILMTPDTMRQRADEAKNRAEDMEKIISSMDSLKSALENEWKGESQVGYEDRYAKIRPSLVNAKGLLEEISTNLKATAKIMEETDQNIANQYRQ